MIKKILLAFLIFLAAGELLLQLDARFQFLAASKVVRIKTSVEETAEYNLIKKDSLNTNGNNFRVMVLGDSYIHGGGIQFKNAFSQQLKMMLQKANMGFDDIYVLDISKPSSNNFDNVQAYVDFAAKFKPDVVILGYNYNDVEGSLDQKVIQDAAVDSFSKKQVSSNVNKRWIKKLTEFLYHSKVVEYVLRNAHDELKAHGHIMTNSAFDLMLKSYYENKPNWIRSKELLQGLIDDCQKNNSQLVVLKFTEINLLEYTGLFEKTDSSIKSFFTASPGVDYFNVSEIFKNEKSKDYILSKYDGHPNEKAHAKIATAVFEEMKKLPATKGRFSK